MSQTQEHRPHAPDPVIVKLTEPFVLSATQLGLRRHWQNLRAKAGSGGYGAVTLPLWRHIVGAVGERCVAKYLGLQEAAPVGDMSQGDLKHPASGLTIQVRSTDFPEGALILHKPNPRTGEVKDDPEQPFVLPIWPGSDECRLIGWAYGRDVMIERFWGDKGKNGRPAYFVQWWALRPMRELKETLARFEPPILQSGGPTPEASDVSQPVPGRG